MKMLKIILIILGLIALAFFAIGFVVRELPYEAEVTIEKPVEDVFALFNDMEQLSQWIPEVKHYKIIEDKPGKIGDGNDHRNRWQRDGDDRNSYRI
jgi:uncharacterized membrane protein